MTIFTAVKNHSILHRGVIVMPKISSNTLYLSLLRNTTPSPHPKSPSPKKYQNGHVFFLQLYFEAYDRGDPVLVSTGRAQVSVEVLRNHAPSFQTSSIEKTIEENAGPQSSVADLIPFDEDSQVRCLIATYWLYISEKILHKYCQDGRYCRC